MNNADIVCLACYQNGGAFECIHIENIAIRAYKIAPEKFSWKHYPERIDLRTVQYALKDEALRDGARIQGNLREGYQLTPTGLKWAEEFSKSIQDTTEPKAISATSNQIDAERHRIRNTEAFKKIVKGDHESLMPRDFEAFLRINEYFPPNLRAERIAKIKNVVHGDSQLEWVWNTLYEKFGEHDNAE
jgi:hypothetical protein